MARFDINNTILAGIPLGTIQTYLTQAQAAYAQLITGQRPVTVSYEGKSVTYNMASVQNLEAWIELLQRALGYNRGRRALRPYFR